MKIIIYTSSFTGALVSIILFNEYYGLFDIDLNSNMSMVSTFSNRSFLGQYYCFIVPSSIISFFLAEKDKMKLLMLICLMLTLGGAILCRVRAAWVGLAVSILIFIILNREIIFNNLKHIVMKKIKIIILMISIISMIYIIFLPLPGRNHKTTIWSSISTISELKFSGGRLNMYKSTVEMIKDHPVFGVGLGNWKFIYPKYSVKELADRDLLLVNNSTITHAITPSYRLDFPIIDASESYTDFRWPSKNMWGFEKIRQRPHNDFLWVFSEVGIFGLVFIISFLFYHLRLLFTSIKKCKEIESDRLIFMFCLMSIIAIMIESMFDFPLERTIPNLYFWSIMGFIATHNRSNPINVYYRNFLFTFLFISFFSVSLFSYFDIKSNLYSQDAKYYNKNNMTKQLLLASDISRSYYRTVDNVGTPLYYFMGIAQYQLNNKARSLSFFKRSLDIAPYHLGCLMNYLILNGELGNLDKAYNTMKIIEEVYPRMAKPRLDMAKFFIKDNQEEKAQKILLEMERINLNDQHNTRRRLLSILKE